MTTLHFLSHAANTFLRWSVKPAVLALNGWARRAEITCDRAGLICTRDLDVSIGCLVKLALGSRKLYSDVNLEEYLRPARRGAGGLGRFDELTRSHPYLPKRVAALRAVRRDDVLPEPGRNRARGGRVAEALPAGTSKEECDARVAELLSVLPDDARTKPGRQPGRQEGRHPRRARRTWRRRPRRPGCRSVARDVRDVAHPKLDDERFSPGRARRVQPRQVDVRQRAARRAAAADGHHAHDGAAHPRQPRRPPERDGGDARRASARKIEAAALADCGPSRAARRRPAARRRRPERRRGREGRRGPLRRARPPVAAAREQPDHRRHAGRQRHQRAARRDHLRLPAARRRGDLPARRDPDPDRVGAPVPRGAHPALHASA